MTTKNEEQKKEDKAGMLPAPSLIESIDSFISNAKLMGWEFKIEGNSVSLEFNAMDAKVETWLPCFDGFYCTVWQPDETNEIAYINQERKAKGWKAITFDHCQFDYEEYNNTVVNGIARFLENELKPFITDIALQRIRSPREYNFANDAADIIVTLTRENKRAIGRYLAKNAKAFADYLRQTYTSRSGFISSYPNYIDGFMCDKPLEHKHKLGSILQFIAANEGISNETIYYNVEANLSCVNYSELTEKKRVKKI